MADVNEWFFTKVVDMAHHDGRLEAQLEACRADNERLGSLVKQQQAELDAQRGTISELHAMLQQQNQNRPQVVVQQFFLLSVPKTRDYVSGLGNDGRQFVCHMLHQTLSDDTPMSVMAQVDEMTRLKQNEGGSVVVERNFGPVNGSITTQHIGMGQEGHDTLQQIESRNGYEHE